MVIICFRHEKAKAWPPSKTYQFGRDGLYRSRGVVTELETAIAIGHNTAMYNGEFTSFTTAIIRTEVVWRWLIDKCHRSRLGHRP